MIFNPDIHVNKKFAPSGTLNNYQYNHHIMSIGYPIDPLGQPLNIDSVVEIPQEREYPLYPSASLSTTQQYRKRKSAHSIDMVEMSNNSSVTAEHPRTISELLPVPSSSTEGNEYGFKMPQTVTQTQTAFESSSYDTSSEVVRGKSNYISELY